MPRTGDEQGKSRQPRTVTVTRPAKKWVLKEAAGFFDRRTAFWNLEHRRAEIEDDYDAEQAAMLDLLRCGLGITRSGVLSGPWRHLDVGEDAPPERVSATMAIIFAWRVAQCLFSGKKLAPAQLEDLDRACAGHQEERNIRRKRDKQLAARLRYLAGKGDPELAQLAQELPYRPLSDEYLPWWQAAHWIRGIVAGPASRREYLLQRFHLCQECGCVIVLRKRKGRTRHFCDRHCRLRYARKKPDP